MRQDKETEKSLATAVLNLIIQLTRLGKIPWEKGFVGARIYDDYSATLSHQDSPFYDILALRGDGERDGGPKLFIYPRDNRQKDHEQYIFPIIQLAGHREIYKLFQLVWERCHPEKEVTVSLNGFEMCDLIPEKALPELVERLETFREQK